MMPRILIPCSSAEEWKVFLADPGHWRTGYSARSLAHCWQDAAGFPISVAQALESTPSLSRSQVLFAIPEHKVPLPGGSRPSQTDLWVLARTDGGLVSIAVEGKVSEPFGPTVGEWLASPSEGKLRRLDYLRELLQLPDPVPQDLRYQLLHRTASALIEAERYFAEHAVMLVHSFSQTDEWFSDFARFAEALGATAVKGELIAVPRRTRPTLYLGWVRGEAQYLES
jgi:hypothetical protein